MSRACFWRREPTFEVRPGDCIPAPAPRQPDRQKRDCGASHHGELAARRPGMPDPGMGQLALAQGTHLGQAAEPMVEEGGRWSRHVPSPYFLPLSFNRAEGEGVGAKENFLSSRFRRRQTFRGRVAMAASCRKPEYGEICFQGHRPRRGSLFSCWEGGGGRPRPSARARALLACGTSAADPRSSPGCRQRRSCPASIRTPAGAARPHKGSGAPGRASTWRWAGGCGRDCRWAVRSHAGLRFSRRPPGWSLHQKGQVNSPLPSPSVRWLALFGCTANVSHGRKSSFVFFFLWHFGIRWKWLAPSLWFLTFPLPLPPRSGYPAPSTLSRIPWVLGWCTFLSETQKQGLF